MNFYPSPTCEFILKKRYRYVWPKEGKIKTLIDLELYPSNICVVSFFQKGMGNEKTKYSVRANLTLSHALGVLTACIKAFQELPGSYAFVFSAANDVGINKEYNARYSAYNAFLSSRFPNYDQQIQKGSIALNTLMLYPQDFQYKKDADDFYERFKVKTQENTISAN